jgi:hypothetical protein
MTVFLGDYQLAVYHPLTRVLLDIVTQDRWFDLKYSLVLNGVGRLRVSLPITDPLVDWATLTDVIVVVMRRHTENGIFENEGAYLIRYSDTSEIDERTGREIVILAGQHANHLLARRQINVDDDPVGVAGFVTRSGDAPLVMGDYVRYQCVDPQVNTFRAMPYFLIAPSELRSYFDTFQRRNTDDNLLAVLQEIANQDQNTWCDFTVEYEHPYFVFYPRQIGTDKSETANYLDFLLFNPKRGNLTKPRLTWDRDEEITGCYVAGQGLTADRVFILFTADTSEDSPYNLIEAVTDGRSYESYSEIESAGISYLNEHRAEQKFEFELDIDGQASRYRVDWELGDIVSVGYVDYAEDHRIIQVEVTLGGGFEERIKIKTQKWRLTVASAGALLIDSDGYFLLDSDGYYLSD